MNKEQMHLIRDTLLILLFGAGIIIFFGNYIMQMLALWEYPMEYRDCAVFKLVDDLAHGNNPYTIGKLSADAPPVVLDSGFLHIYPAVFMVALFEMPASGAVYLTNLIYLVIITILTVRICCNITLPKNNSEKRLAAVVILYACLAVLLFMDRKTYLVSRPDIFCVALLLLMIYLFTKQVFKQRYIYISSLACVLIAFAKVHYAIILVSIIIYMLCKQDKQQKIRNVSCFIISGIVFAGLLCIVLQILYPTYLSEWIPRILAMFMDNKEFDSASISILIDKVKRVRKMLQAEVVIIVIGIIAWIISGIRKCFEVDNVLAFLGVNIIVNLLVLLYTGRHMGADLWYFYVMLFPSVIFLTVKIMYQFKEKQMVCTLMIVFVLLNCQSNLSNMLKDTEIKMARAEDFDNAYEILEKYASQEMFVSPYLSNYSIENGIYNYNYGDTCYLVDDEFCDKLYEVVPFVEALLPYSKEIYHQHEEYICEMIDKIENKEYSVIALDDLDSIPHIHGAEFKEAVQQNYRVADEMEVEINGGQRNIFYWIPNK